MDNFIKQEEEAIDQVNSFTEEGRKVECIFQLIERLKKMLNFSIQFDESGKMRHVFDEDNGTTKEILETQAKRRLMQIFNLNLEHASQMGNDYAEKTRIIEGFFNFIIIISLIFIILRTIQSNSSIPWISNGISQKSKSNFTSRSCQNTKNKIWNPNFPFIRQQHTIYQK